ncbi:putative ABC transport system permease protein [Anseongella ginsenosidimutans]|uniref:Putative ABC transport system permease protein n=1 Tax=Anseongella ginsenosidimutans TaxID=496056 RepID=A0A4R3KM15_9SPHI|nr:ABC transporter permease [Anseongella ginsenosidimutans]QEC52798.1 FtsX-like permease family protein [Anseongella ginsenosidimutans]TCS84702.1 putative ABC transport system permease protein [Anseongella ginsenosidimutans]
MLRNYLKIAFRNLWKHRLFSIINITGLAVGMTACFLIFLYVSFELSYDKFHSKADRIYRLVCNIKTPTETIDNFSNTGWAMAPNIQSGLPEVESFVRLKEDDVLVRKGTLKFQEKNAVWADSAFFRVFDFKLLSGHAGTVLKEPFSIVLTQSAAKKYFGNEDPVGQTLTLPRNDMTITATVTGLMQDIPENSQIKGDILISMSSRKAFSPGEDEQWNNLQAISYLLLKPGASASTLEAKFPAFLEDRRGDIMRHEQMFFSLFLEPLKDIYLHSNRVSFEGKTETGSMRNVYVFSSVALLILLIACFNFINLTTARASQRAREVGVRKVVGAVKKNLSLQFIGESVLMCLMAYVLAVILSALLLPVFNYLAGKAVAQNLFENPFSLLILLLGAIGIGILAGFYPAWVLASFKPVTVLKGRFVTSAKGIMLRRGLVVAQFAISLILIASTIIVYKQLTYMRTQDLGFRKDHTMVIDSYSDPARYAFKEAIDGLSGVQSTTISSHVPGGDHSGYYAEIENRQGDMQVTTFEVYLVDFDFISQYQVKMAAGRQFSRNFATDSTQAMILNEAAADMLGYRSPEEALGGRFNQNGRVGKIIGVVKDFHYHSLREKIQPLTMRIEPNEWKLISVKVSAADLPATIAAIENAWNALIPARPFTYRFLDTSFDNQYRGEERFGRLFLNFAILAIFISCLGLLGLASYTTLQRTKEIGIRKVMGASVASVVTLLSKDFIKLVGIAILIAVPLVLYAMRQWLEGFAYQTAIAWWVFVLAGLLALVVALLTIGFQSVRAALMNPVKSLRSE